MKVRLKLATPKNEKEELFRLETEVNDLENPGEARLFIDGREYVLELCFDNLNY